MKLLLALLTAVSSYSLFCVEKRFISLCVIIFIIIVVSLKYRHNRKYLIFLIILCSVFITLSLVQIKTFQNNGTYTGIVLEKKSSYVIIFDGLEKIYFRTKDLNIDLFDIVKVDGNLIDFQPYKKPLESGFDFLKYLNDKGVRREIVSNSYTTIFNNGINIVQFKSRIINQFNQGV